jgi:hypothetical protein
MHVRLMKRIALHAMNGHAFWLEYFLQLIVVGQLQLMDWY